MHHPIEQRHIAPQAMLNRHVGETGQLDVPGVGYNQLGAFFLGPEDPTSNQGVTGCCVGTDDKDAAGIFNLGNGICHGSTSESGGQTDHRGGMSEPRAVVDVVGADDGPGEFLCQVIFFVGNFGGDKDADAVRSVGVNDFAKTIRDNLYGLVPVRFYKPAKGFNQRLFQSHEAVDMLVKIPAFNAQPALVDRMGFQGQRALNFSIDDFK